MTFLTRIALRFVCRSRGEGAAAEICSRCAIGFGGASTLEGIVAPFARGAIQALRTAKRVTSCMLSAAEWWYWSKTKV
jgi:hypothetical protein